MSDDPRPGGAPDGDASGPAPEGPASTPSRRRGRRRAVGGTATGDDGGPVLGRSRDETDEGWGERPAGDDDERFLRDVPPHW